VGNTKVTWSRLGVGSPDGASFPHLGSPDFTFALSPVAVAPSVAHRAFPHHRSPSVGYLNMRWSTLVLPVALFYSFSFVNAIPHEVDEKRHWLHRRQSLSPTSRVSDPVIPSPSPSEVPQRESTSVVSPTPPPDTPSPSSRSSSSTSTPTPPPPTPLPSSQSSSQESSSSSDPIPSSSSSSPS